MGKYINNINDVPLPEKGKAKAIIDLVPGAQEIEQPSQWHEGIVCVVYNARFEAAGYAYDAGELEHFKYPDGRMRTWLHVPDAKLYAE